MKIGFPAIRTSSVRASVVRRLFLKALTLPAIGGTLAACASGGSDSIIPVGTTLGTKVVTNTDGMVPSGSIPGFFVAGIPYGGRIIQTSADLALIYSHPSLSGVPLPTVNFTTQSVVCYTDPAKFNVVWDIERVSTQQVIVSSRPKCGSGSPASSLGILVAVVDGVVGLGAVFALDRIGGC